MIREDTLGLMAKLEARTARVGVVGLGYVGLPLALTFREHGWPVLGLDIDQDKISRLAAGASYLRHIPAERIARSREGERPFEATTDFDQVAKCDAIVICVPTPLTREREPDMSYIVHTTEAIAPYLRPGHLVVLESTTWPGTTDEVVRPILERGGLKAGRDFFLAFSPEREDPGNPKFETRTIPKVVGGHTPQCLAHAVKLYEGAIDKVVPVSSTQAAELSKLFENIFRCVNIALVNELKQLCHRMDLDVHEVIDAAATKPFGFMPFHPGPGLGGHCIPIDPFYLTWKAREFDFSTRFIELAGEINTNMPYYVVQRTLEAMSRRGRALSGSHVLVVGLAYKKNVDDVRESPSFRVIELLQKQGATVSYHDPYVPKTHRMRHHDVQLQSRELTEAELRGVDAAIILTDHDVIDYARLVRHVPLVIDTRNATKDVPERDAKVVPA
jgi:UDP-N-acetyl-D-glucosamine dehydrogenase